MIKPPIPENEEARLLSLRTLNLLDTPLQENFERITRITQAFFKVPIVSFTLIDADRQWFKSIQGLNATETPRDLSFCGHVINQNELLVVENPLHDERFLDNPYVIGHPNIRFYAGYPVHSPDGFKIGTISIIDNKPRTFTNIELDALKEMARLLEKEISTKSISNAQRKLCEELDQSKRESMIDGLTRLWNRTGIELLMEKRYLEAQSKNQGFGVALIDIDNFKSINEKYGHNLGDSILRSIAKKLIAGYRKIDIVGHWGGEEFLVILEGDTPDSVYTAAERARGIICAQPFIFDNQEIYITITTGLAYFDPQLPLIDLVAYANKALCDGKINGKNMVIFNQILGLPVYTNR